MSTCPSDNDLVMLLRNELADEVVSKVAGHIDACQDCQKKLDQITTGDFLDDHSTFLSHSHSEQSDVLDNLLSKLVNTPPKDNDFRSRSKPSWSIDFPGAPTIDAPLGTLGVYAIVDRIADGGHGSVYRALDTRVNREVAIKVLRQCSDESRARFQREARAAAALKDEHIVTLYESGNHVDFPPYLVMEYVSGDSLSAKLRDAGPLDPKLAANIARDVAEGLACAHRHGLVHRDIKPSNVLIEASTGKAKITDFGLVRDESSDSLLTLENAIAGTPAYMSPEQITDPSTVDARSDIYSLGVMLYQLLTGVVPFRGVLRMTVLQVVHDDPPPPSYYNDSVPRDLQTICLKAMSKSPERRYAESQMFADDLQRWLNGDLIHAKPMNAIGKGIRWCQRNRLIAGLATSVMLLSLFLAAGSLTVAKKLSNDAASERVNALVAQEQRNAMIDTLGKLIFQLQEDFEDDKMDYDVVQESALEIALDGFERINLKEGFSKDVLYHMAAGHRKMGELYDRASGGEDDARRALKTAADLLVRSASAEEFGERERSLLIGIYWDLGDIDISTNNFDQAVEQYGKALQLAEQDLEKVVNGSVSAANRVVVSHYRLAGGQLALNNLDESLQHARKALEIAAESADFFLDKETELDQFDLQQLLGFIEFKKGDLSAAETLFQTNLSQALNAIDGTSETIYLYQYAFVALEELAQLARDAGDPELVQSHADRISYLENEVFQLAIQREADCLLESFLLYVSVENAFHIAGDSSREHEYIKRRCRFLEKWIEEFPNDALGIVDLAISYQELAATKIKMDQTTEAAELLDRAIELHNTLSPSDGNSSVNAIWLLEVLVDAAELQHNLGNKIRVENLTQLALKQVEFHKRNQEPSSERLLRQLVARLDAIVGE